MRHGSLFSGIGGFDLAAEWMGWENVFHCEWMEFPRKVLDYYWPNADSHIDICKTDFKKYANKIDILTGGFPCQPFSMAGKRKGTEDERYLWGEMLRAVQEIKPKFVIAENVFGITNIDGGLVFEQVCLDLENEGYEVQSFIIPAAAKNAPHRRDRCWFIGVRNATDNHGIIRREGGESKPRKQSRHGKSNEGCDTQINGIATNSEHLRCAQCEQQRQSRCEQRLFEGVCDNGDVTNTNGFRYRGGNIQPRTNKFKEWKMDKNLEQHRNRVWCKVKGCSGDATNTLHKGLQRGPEINGREKYNAERGGNGINIGADGKNISGKIRREFQEFPTQSPICGGDDGLPTELDGITFSKWRAESIKGYGNAIVPQVAYELFKIISKLL
jgi:DNA (cytosine-5)-methyltransferase 1